MTHICVGNLTIISSDIGLLPDQCQAITWTNAGILLIGPMGTNFSEILIKIHTFSSKKMHLETLSAKRQPFCLGLNVLMSAWSIKSTHQINSISQHRDIWEQHWAWFHRCWMFGRSAHIICLWGMKICGRILWYSWQICRFHGWYSLCSWSQMLRYQLHGSNTGCRCYFLVSNCSNKKLSAIFCSTSSVVYIKAQHLGT